MSKIDPELTDSLEKAIAAGLSPQPMESFSKKIKDLSVELEEDLIRMNGYRTRGAGAEKRQKSGSPACESGCDRKSKTPCSTWCGADMTPEISEKIAAFKRELTFIIVSDGCMEVLRGANEAIDHLTVALARSSERMAEATERGDRYHEENNELFKRAVEAERVGAAAQLDAKLMAENWTEADERAAAVEVRLAEAIKVIKPFALLCDLEVKADQGELDSVYPMVAVGRLRAARAFLDADR